MQGAKESHTKTLKPIPCICNPQINVQKQTSCNHPNYGHMPQSIYLKVTWTTKSSESSQNRTSFLIKRRHSNAKRCKFCAGGSRCCLRFFEEWLHKRLWTVVFLLRKGSWNHRLKNSEHKCTNRCSEDVVTRKQHGRPSRSVLTARLSGSQLHIKHLNRDLSQKRSCGWIHALHCTEEGEDQLEDLEPVNHTMFSSWLHAFQCQFKS